MNHAGFTPSLAPLPFCLYKLQELLLLLLPLLLLLVAAVYPSELQKLPPAALLGQEMFRQGLLLHLLLLLLCTSVPPTPRGRPRQTLPSQAGSMGSAHW